jgi:hypothetical protein
MMEWVRIASSPDLPGLSRQLIEGRKRRFLAYTSPSRSPDPHHLVVLAHPGFVRIASILPGISRIGLSSATLFCCDRISGGALSSPLDKAAPHGAQGREVKDLVVGVESRRAQQARV